MECKRFLTHTLKLWRERGNEYQVARTLVFLSDANRLLGLPAEGIQQGEEALGILERLGDTVTQADSLVTLSLLFHKDQQLDAAEEAASRAIGLVSEKDNQPLVCRAYRVLGDIYQSKGETEEAIHHYELALGIASSLDWDDLSFWVNLSLTELFLNEDRFDHAHAHIERAKSHAVDGTFELGRAVELEAKIWYKQHRLEEARSEALRAVEVFEKLGATNKIEDCRSLLRDIRKD